MPSPIDLMTVIEDSISDSTLEPEVSAADTSTETPLEATESAPGETSTGTPEGAPTGEAEGSGGPAKAPAGEVIDKRLGISAQTDGRENRIPYSRVKKIVENAEKAALKPLQAKLAEFEPKIADYEARLTKVAEFEQVMLNDGPRFLQMLATIPAYQPFFKAVEELQLKLQGQSQSAQTTEQTVDNDPMPEPDDKDNGVYTMTGLKALLDWQSRQVEARVTKQVTSRYEPLEKGWKHEQDVRARREYVETKVIPAIDAQIKDARTWPMFNDNEVEIVKHLQANPQAQLQDSYRAVVFPKLQASRDSMRTQILAELKQAPQSTSAPVRQTKASPEVNTGHQSIEDIIRGQLKDLPGR